MSCSIGSFINGFASLRFLLLMLFMECYFWKQISTHCGRKRRTFALVISTYPTSAFIFPLAVPKAMMELELGCLELRCYCGKVFSQQSALTNHTRSCKQSNKRLASALNSAKEVWEARKARKRQKTEEHEQVVEPILVQKEPELRHPLEPEVRLQNNVDTTSYVKN